MNAYGSTRIRAVFSAALLLLAAAPVRSAQADAYAPGGSAAAGPAITGPSGSLPWADNTRYDDCDHDCLYEKANENLSLQVGYIEQRIAILEDKVRRQDGQSDVFNELQNEGYCLASDNNSASKCLERYKSFQALELQKLRAAIVRNEDARARLMSRKVYVGGGVEGSDLAVPGIRQLPNAAPKLAQTPYVPTYNDLQNQFNQESVRLRTLTSESYKDWLRNYPTRPSADDFVLTKKIYRNPDDPSEGTLEVIATDAQGRPLHDDAAYQAALQAYQARAAAMNQDLPQLARQGLPPRGNIGFGALVSDNSHKGYNRARAELVQTANSVLRQSNPASRIVSVSEANFGPSASSHSTGPQPASVLHTTGVIESGVNGGHDPANPDEAVVQVRHAAGDNAIQTTTVSRDPDQIDREINRIELPEP